MTCRGRHRLWTEADDEWLRREWGKTDIALLAFRMKRSVSALTEHARKLKLQRDTLTLRAFARLHAVPISRVYWAMEQRGLKPERVRRADPRQIAHHGAHYALTPEEQELLRPLLHSRPKRLLGLDGKKTPRGVWGIGTKPPCCRECSTTERPHYSNGYCQRCAVRVWKWVNNRHKGRPSRGQPPRSLFIN